jgi:hypothetical protein
VKMSNEAREMLAKAITPLDTPDARTMYVERRFPRAEFVKDLDKRYRWDLMSAALGYRFACEQYDAGLNDSHIDTALRNIVQPLGD